MDNSSQHLPLAVRMRPKSLKEFVGQSHILLPGSPLRRLIEGDKSNSTVPGSLFLWGPAGSGKTTLAYLIAQNSNRRFVELSAVSSGVKEVREVIDDAKELLIKNNQETVLFIDEIHRFSKAQQDALLPSVESRTIILIAATTENPYFSVIDPLLSRSILLTLYALSNEELQKLIANAVKSKSGLNNEVKLDKGVDSQLIRYGAGDVRKVFTLLEAAAGIVLTQNGQKESNNVKAKDPKNIQKKRVVKPTITFDVLSKVVDGAFVKYDKNSDEHYDVASAFIKSMRGSDVDAALHYLARMCVAGEDPRFIARRIMIAASEEIGMADSSALLIAVSCAQAVEKIGMPESQLILAQAVIHICLAPKSNAVTNAISSAINDVKTKNIGVVPIHLRDSHYQGAKHLGHGKEYLYAHDYPFDIVKQQYLPDELYNSGKDSVQYYFPKPHGKEKLYSRFLSKIRKILR